MRHILLQMPLFSNATIFYKLHPGEYGRFKLYPAYIDLSKYKNVKFVEDVDLYSLLASSEYHVGVFSTALYEGMEFGCKTLILDLPGIEYVTDLLTTGKASMLRQGVDAVFKGTTVPDLKL